MSLGRASVVKSRSVPSRPSSASRTEPPTSEIAKPPAVKRRPTSSITGVAFSSSRTAVCCTWLSAALLTLGAGSSVDTGNHCRTRTGRGAPPVSIQR
jgi:hypothetical protein